MASGLLAQGVLEEIRAIVEQSLNDKLETTKTQSLSLNGEALDLHNRLQLIMVKEFLRSCLKIHSGLSLRSIKRVMAM
jgi:hypothetical protein